MYLYMHAFYIAVSACSSVFHSNQEESNVLINHSDPSEQLLWQDLQILVKALLFINVLTYF